MRIIALCKNCHEATHMGLAQVKGRGKFALEHLMKVRNVNHSSAECHVREAFDLWNHRNNIEWSLDLSIITDSGIKLAKKIETHERMNIARDETLQVREVESLNFDNRPIKKSTPNTKMMENKPINLLDTKKIASQGILKKLKFIFYKILIKFLPK